MAVLPHLAKETLSAWRWAWIKLAVGLAAVVVTGVFMAVNLAPLKTLSRAGPVLPSVEPAKADLPAEMVSARQSLNAGITKESKAYTGVVLDEQEHPIPGARVWVGFGFSPSAKGKVLSMNLIG